MSKAQVINELWQFMRENNLAYTKYSREQLPEVVAELLADGKVIGLHHGRMEIRAAGYLALECFVLSKDRQPV
jgi:predicted NodU family carbamoyl transferase